MKGRTKKRSSTTEASRKPILINSRDRDVVLEAVEEALIPQPALNNTRKIRKR